MKDQKARLVLGRLIRLLYIKGEINKSSAEALLDEIGKGMVIE